MRIQNVMRLVGRLLLVLSGFMLIPLVYGIFFERPYYIFLWCSALVALVGWLLFRYGRDATSFSLRDGFLVVGVTWMLGSFFASLPFYLSGMIPSFVNALFEAVSGMTATGATILEDVDALPKTFILWRSLTHWMGGMGIIVLVLAFLRNLGADAAHLFQAEASVPRPGIVLPRIRSMASSLWKIYLLLTGVCIVLLSLAGVELFDAVNIAFSTLATGGFTPTSDGIFKYEGHYWVNWIMILFMILAGGNFTVYHAVMQKGVGEIFRDFEYRMYLYSLIGGASIVTLSLLVYQGSLGLSDITDASFSLISLQTGSGFAIVDYTTWPHFAQMMLFLSTFFGGCSGSTTGAIKMIRIIILLKSSIMYLRKAIHPDMVQLVHLNGKPLPTKWLQVTQQFFFLYLLVFGVSALLMSSTGLSIEDSLSSVTGLLGNVGLAFGPLGPMGSFNVLSDFAKCVGILDMLLGRLELFTLLVLLHPGFWQGYFVKSNTKQRTIIDHRNVKIVRWEGKE